MATTPNNTPNSVKSKSAWEALFSKDWPALEKIQPHKFKTQSNNWPHSTPFHFAAKDGSDEAIRIMATEKTSFLLLNAKSEFPLSLLMANGKWDLLEGYKEKIKADFSQQSTDTVSHLSKICFLTAISKGELEWASFFKEMGAEFTPLKEDDSSLGDFLTKDEWHSYRESRNRNYFLDIFWQGLEKASNNKFASFWKRTEYLTPPELFFLLSEEEEKEKARKLGIVCELDEIPHQQLLLFLYLSVSSSGKTLPAEVTIALFEKVCEVNEVFNEEEEKEWLFFDLFLNSVENLNEEKTKKIAAYAQKRWDTNFYVKTWPLLEQNSFNGITRGVVKRQVNALTLTTSLILKAKNGQSRAFSPMKKEEHETRLACGCKQLERMFDWGCDKKFVEPGWGYSLVHFFAASNCIEGLKALGEGGYEIWSSNSGKTGKGKTPKALAESKGHQESVQIIESMILKREFATPDATKKKRSAL